MSCAKHYMRQKFTLIQLFTEIAETIFSECDNLCVWGMSVVLNHVLSYKCSRYNSGTIIIEFLVQIYLILVDYNDVLYICVGILSIYNNIIFPGIILWHRHRVVRKQDGSSKKLFPNQKFKKWELPDCHRYTKHTIWQIDRESMCFVFSFISILQIYLFLLSGPHFLQFWANVFQCSNGYFIQWCRYQGFLQETIACLIIADKGTSFPYSPQTHYVRDNCNLL